MAIEKWIITPGQTKVIDLEQVRALKVSLIGGRVNVIAHDEPGARVEVTSVSGKDLKIEIDGDRLSIDHPQLRWDNWIDAFKGFTGHAKAEVSILAPRDVAIKLGVVSAEALVSGFTSDARLNSVSGDIVADHLTGDVEVNTVSGELSVGNHVGAIRANTVSGDITASGEVSKFSADGVTGNMVLDSTAVPHEIVTNTVSGALTVRMLQGAGARYRLNTISGTIQLDDLSMRGTMGKGFERVIGELDGVWTDVQANSVSGNVSVVRRVAERHEASASERSAE
ncbi:DUF4097 family beta strand repeat-containing protein [Rathayibacter sp. YIM 133350]|uniref:DUF4097 family beta strand repeat-containing protein n=1 Tax=Rathayibacter sp. YIM 133350 TaxID=3131992 RepID=UPI00307FAC5D